MSSKGEIEVPTGDDVETLKSSQTALRRRIDELSAADRHKNEFLAMLAHELRNPLAPLRNAVAILKAAGDDPIQAQYAREVIERQVATMGRLVDDLLDAARVTRGQIQLRRQKVELETVLDHAVETAAHLFQSRNHRLSVVLPPTPIVLEADPTRLEQVFSNLLSNAAKFTPEGGNITVTAEVPPTAADTGALAVIRVKDNGIGIAPEMLGQVFELFTQVDQSLARSRGGLGIGLRIVQSLVELHGGEVTADSDGLGHGTEFTIRLPVVRTDGAVETKTRPETVCSETVGDPSTRTDKHRVLVVDDNADAADALATLLSMSGHIVRTGIDGVTALETAASFHPDVVLVDLGMPGMDGYELLKRLREQPEMKTTFVAALTGYSHESYIERSREAGFDAHFVKPVDTNVIEATLANLRN